MVTLFKSRHILTARFLPDAVRTFAPINMRISLLFLSCLHVVAASAQPGADAPNVTDAKGLKQGEWSRTWHDSQQVRYTGRFVDDVPVGTFTYYSNMYPRFCWNSYGAINVSSRMCEPQDVTTCNLKKYTR